MAGEQDPTFSDTGQSGVNLGGPGQGSLTGFIQSMVNIHAQRQKSAAGDLDRQLLAAQKGFPVDPKAIEKTAKKAGIPLMHPDDMKGLLEKPAQQGQTAKPSIDTQQPDQYTQAYNVKAISDVKDRQKVETNHAIDGMVRQAVTNHALRGANEQQVMEYTGQLMTKKQAALNGDSRALGQLAAAGEMKLDIPTNVWQGYSPKQKEQFLEMQRGAETESQKNGRMEAAAIHLIDVGAFNTPEAAYQAATALADGKGLTPEMRAQMRPTSMTDMTKEVGIADNLAGMGFSGDQIWNMARGANLTGISNYFPKGFTTLQQQQMAARKQQIGIEGMNAQTGRMEVTGYTDKSGKKVAGRLETEAARTDLQSQELDIRQTQAESTAKKIDMAMKTKEDKDFVAQYTALADIKRAGGRVDDDVMKLMEKKLVEKAGGQVTVEEVNNFFHFITGGTHPVLKMGVSPSSAQKLMDQGDMDSGTDDTDPASSGAGRPQ